MQIRTHHCINIIYSTYQTLLLVGLSFECPKTVLTSKGNLFPLKQSVLLTYQTIISYAYPHCGNILTNILRIYKYN